MGVYIGGESCWGIMRFKENAQVFDKNLIVAIVGPMVQKNQKELTEKLQHSNAVAFLRHMNSILEKNGDNNGKEGYMVGNGVSSNIFLRCINCI